MVSLVLRAYKVFLAPRDLLELLAHKVRPENRGRSVLRVHKGSQALLVLREKPGPRALLVLRVRLDLRVNRVRMVQTDHLVLMVCQRMRLPLTTDSLALKPNGSIR